MSHCRILTVVMAAMGLAMTGWSQAPAPQDSGATIKVGSSEVLLDVTVRDRKGKLVKNLKPGDVEVYEDGVKQAVTSFRLAGVRETATRKGAEKAKEVKTAAAKPLRGVHQIAIVFHNIDPVGRVRAVQAVQEFLTAELTKDTYIGLFLLDDRLKPVQPFTNNRDELRNAVANVFNGRIIDFDLASELLLTANPTMAVVDAMVAGDGRSANPTLKVTGGEVSKTVVTGADVATGQGANAMRGDRVRERQDFSNIMGRRETDKIHTMFEELGTLPGRKTVMLVSTGLVTTGDPDEWDKMFAKAAKAGITVYALDTRELDTTASNQAGNLALNQVAGVSRTQSQAASAMGGASEARTKSRQGDALEEAVRNSSGEAGLRTLAEATGGFLIANTNEFRKPFQKIMDDLETHYEVSYRPAAVKLDGRLRKIEVKTARGDLSVESRTGYFALPETDGGSGLKPHEVLGLALLQTQPLPRQFEFRTAAWRFGREGEPVLGYEVAGGSLKTSSDAARGVEKMRYSLLSLVKDANGEVVDRYSLDVPFEAPAAAVAAAKAGVAVHTHGLKLAPGRYTVETAVLDREGGRASTEQRMIEVQAPKTGLRMSNVVLVQRVEEAPGAGLDDPLVMQGKRMVPMVATTLRAEMKPSTYFVVYPDKANPEKATLQVDFLLEGQVAGRQVAELPAADESGAVRMLIGAVVKPGNCQLRVTARQGKDAVASTVAYTVEGGQ